MSEICQANKGFLIEIGDEKIPRMVLEKSRFSQFARAIVVKLGDFLKRVGHSTAK